MTKKKVNGKILKNNPSIAFNVLYAKTGKIYPTYVSKHDSKHEKQIVFLTIEDKEKQHLTVTKLSALIRKIKSTNNTNFFGLNCLHRERFHEKVLQILGRALNRDN